MEKVTLRLITVTTYLSVGQKAETHNTKGHLGWLIERYGGKKDKQYYELIRPDEFVSVRKTIRN